MVGAADGDRRLDDVVAGALVNGVLPWLLACAPDTGDTAEALDDISFLSAPGPYGVGHSQREVTYDDVTGSARTLRTSVWYPTHVDAGFAATYWQGAFTSAVAFEDVEPAVDAEFPTVAFSHGSQGYAEAASFLAEHLASHGYYVLAPDHTGNTTLDGSSRDTAIYLQRPGDLTAVVDALFSGQLVPEPRPTGDVVAVGHSFGGYGAYALSGAAYDVPSIDATCAAGGSESICTSWDGTWSALFSAGAYDDRVAAVVAMAPGDFWLLGADHVAALPVPALLMTGEHDPERNADGPAYAAASARAGGHWVDIAGGAHNTFIDVAGSMSDGQTLDAAVGHRIVRTYVLAHAEHQLGRGRYDRVLEGTDAVDPAATAK